MSHPVLGIICLGMLLFGHLATAQIKVKNGDKIAFLGDSITQYGNRPIGYLNLVMSGLEVNGVKAIKIPAGISGNKSPQMLARLERDVLSKAPQFMTLSCGVNDVWHGDFKRGVSLEDYRKNITQIVERAQKAGIDVLILTSTMIHENQQERKNQKLVGYNDFLRELAKEKRCVLVDLNADMQAELTARRKAYPGLRGNQLTLDGVHMNPLGNVMMAKGVLKGLGLNDAQLAKAEKAWLGVRHWQYSYNFTLKEYMKLTEQANKHRMSLDMYVAELIRRELATLKP